MNQKKLISAVVIVLALGTAAWLIASRYSVYANITSYQDCATAGYPVLESYPSQCKTPDGRTFVNPDQMPVDTLPGETGTTTTPLLQTAPFGKPVTLKAGDKIVFPDGLSLTLKNIDDSRCKPGVQCIWQGELSANFSVSLSGSSAELHLGTVTAKSATSKGHTFSLQSMTTVSATVVVVPVASASSGVSGLVHVGPTCPVERIPPDSGCGDRPFVDANIIIKSGTNGNIVAQVTSDKNGQFVVKLAPGSYTVETSSMNGAILPRCQAQEVTVRSGSFSNVDISCDSGIR